MLLSSNERGSRGTRTIFYSVVILSSAHRKLLSLVSANGRPDAAADPGQHDLASWPHSPGMKPLPAPACSCPAVPPRSALQGHRHGQQHQGFDILELLSGELGCSAPWPREEPY